MPNPMPKSRQETCKRQHLVLRQVAAEDVAEEDAVVALQVGGVGGQRRGRGVLHIDALRFEGGAQEAGQRGAVGDIEDRRLAAHPDEALAPVVLRDRVVRGVEGGVVAEEADFVDALLEDDDVLARMQFDALRSRRSACRLS